MAFLSTCISRGILGILGIAISISASAQTFNGTGGTIPDDGNDLQIPLQVSGLPNLTSTFGFETACIDITHTWISDLDVFLIAPDGSTVDLTSGNGGDTDFYTQTCFNQGAENSIIQGSSPYTGTFRPEGSLALFNNGLDPNGTWILRIQDTYPFADEGNLISWSITFGPNPAIPYPFFSSNLPILKINTGGASIPNEPKIGATMQLIHNGPGQINYINDTPNGYNGSIGIELRGNSSLGFPKKSYGFEIWDITQNDSDAVLLDLPPESDFVLHSSYSDKTLMRNALSYGLFAEMGHYSPRCRYVEVVLNGEYQGIYVLMEKIKRDENRLDIARLQPEDISGDELTGGYIWKIDWTQGSFTGGWESTLPSCPSGNGNPVNYLYDEPSGDELMPEQSAYIQAYVSAFENSLATEDPADTLLGYRHFIDTRSFVDALILEELARNVDGYWLSTFFYKDKDSRGGKIHYGPLWDFDLAWRNADYNGGNDPTGWRFLDCGGGVTMPVIYQLLFADTAFQNEVFCRYTELRKGVLSTPALFARIDSMAQIMGTQAIARNFDYWPILGIYVWPNPQPIPSNYEGEILALKSWIALRLGWMDAFLPGNCTVVPPDAVSKPQASNIQVFPNPAHDSFRVQATPGIVRLQLRDITGRLVLSNDASGNSEYNVQFAALPSGMYLLQVELRNGAHETQRLIIE